MEYQEIYTGSEEAPFWGQVDVEDVSCLRLMIVNVCLVGSPSQTGSSDWVLVDAGLGNSAERIIEAAAQRFGPDSHPKAIILTHGHFDHVGSLTELTSRWDVPIYAHESELPYLTGKTDYPPADPSVGGGLMATLSPMFPHKGIDLGKRVHPLPQDGTIPDMPEWEWIHTPGHTPGHISLFRERDQSLIAGDAIITVKQESVWAVLTQDAEIHGPPMYFTTDWAQAWGSVKRLENLQPSIIFTGHGHPMSGPILKEQLSHLAKYFDQLAVPEHGRYIKH
ncbi:MBL fold metallo-hydrolase [Ammoniphilus sp. 3BR4]|uniref:MBL fold metallo-hydrolase n=1 Tax=Ammoniphilus sp. 3BR4 TaxID=3158265 RepID=UPI0034666590